MKDLNEKALAALACPVSFSDFFWKILFISVYLQTKAQRQYSTNMNRTIINLIGIGLTVLLLACCNSYAAPTLTIPISSLTPSLRK